jgi:hypothetical protein
MREGTPSTGGTIVGRGALEKQGTLPAWMWLNLLNLDAPLVAVVWQDFLSRCYLSPLKSSSRWILGIAVWAIYMADELLDLRQRGRQALESPRRALYARYFRIALISLAAALAADLVSAALWLDRPVFANGLWVAGAAVLYLCLFPLGDAEPVWKPLSAATVFASGVFLVAWTQSAMPLSTFALPACAFFALCLLNLLLIRFWERESGSVPEGLLLAIGALAIVCAWEVDFPWYGAIALSATALGAIAVWGDRLSKDARRVAADIVLLSPLLFLRSV